MLPKLCCPHCGNEDQTLISKWIEPRNQIAGAPALDQKYYCEQCGKTWIVQRLPLEEPSGRP